MFIIGKQFQGSRYEGYCFPGRKGTEKKLLYVSIMRIISWNDIICIWAEILSLSWNVSRLYAFKSYVTHNQLHISKK
jgi:hypothetical protein